MKKIVDGKSVDMTDEEIAELQAFAPIEVAPVTTVYSVDFWTRLDGGEDGNSGEVAQVLAVMGQQPIRTRKIFESASSFRSDHELWPLLLQLAITLFGEDRAAQILASSEG
ncbi:hypothetical protein [Agrobacterium tumefaciens]|uniref:hypothetical protein n=1 Tax=Agrobacterium tumefaciens TaxID=358 RepID=UPI001CBE8A2D|nr:hypothetical protein [Agrobacterium tumefaciens]MDP9875630.1 hypothetical protein [Agrobacterium tumefaciens]MDP9980545.1 hypothetical protein [Agrobacterium tumefaciens]